MTHGLAQDVFKVTNAEESAEKEVHEMDNRSRHTPEGQPPFQEIMADQVAVTHAMIHEKNCQIRLPHEDSSIDQSEGSGFPGQKFSGATITASMASDTAITSEAILESLLKFEEERIPLSARLERYIGRANNNFTQSYIKIDIILFTPIFLNP